MEIRTDSVKLLAIIMCLSFAAVGKSEAKRASIPPGQSVIVMSKPGKDPTAFKQRLEKRGLVIVNEIKCAKDSFSIYEVQPKSGNVKAALNQVLNSGDVDLEAAEIKFGSKKSACTPAINDPEFPNSPHLQVLNYTEMKCLLDSMGIVQQTQARVTVIDSGVAPIANELADVVQYNFVGGLNGVNESPFDVQVHGSGVTSILGSTSNNNKLFVGIASLNLPVKIISLRVEDANGIDTLDALRAFTWCIDHQSERGGAGVINFSINSTLLPTYNGSSIVQGLAKSLRKHDDYIINGAGNTGAEDPSKSTKNLRRIGGLDETGMLWSQSTFGPFKAVAPAVNVRCWNASTQLPSGGTGTSFATPCWAGSIALLMSLNPKLTAPKADKIVYDEGRETSQGYIVPDLRAAVIKALKLKP